MEGFDAGALVLLVLLIPLRDAGVEIPAVVVEAGLAGKLLDFSAGFFLEVQKSDDHIRDLHSGVVNVVLHVHLPARELQQADESVAENCVAEVADVGGFVGVDAGVLDQNFAGRNFGFGFLVGDECGSDFASIQSRVDVARSCDLELFETFNRADTVDNLFCNFTRSFAELLGQFEGEREGVLAEFDFRGLLDDDLRQVEIVGAAQKIAHSLGQPAFQVAVQGDPLSY